MASAAQINAKVDDAVSAMDDADWLTAISKLMQVKAMLIGKPDSKKSGTELIWDRGSVDALIRQCRGEQGAKTGMQASNVKYVPPTDTP